MKPTRPMKATRLLHLGAVLALAFSTGACATVFHDSAPVPGSESRLVVGGKEGFLVVLPRIWLLENGEYRRVKIVEED